MRKWAAIVLLLVAACSEVDKVANCTELQSILLTTPSDNGEVLEDIYLKAHDMAADALARGADGESAFCDAIGHEAFDKGVDLSNED